MSKKKDPLESAKNKLDLTSTLNAIDFRNKEYYNNLDDNLKKQYSAFVLMRFMSSAPDQNGLHEYHLTAINDIVNKDFWTLSKHPDLQHKLMCLLGLNKKTYHSWIQNPKKDKSDKIKDIFSKVYKGLNTLEFEVLYKDYSIEDFEFLCQECALDKKETKSLVEIFKTMKENA